jgi:hypothetical protein
MRKRLSQGSWLHQGCLALGVILLAYAILLRGLAAPLPALPGSLEAALANPHFLCLTDANGQGLPSHGPQACGECCLGLTRATAPPPAMAAILTPWPRLVWRPAAPSLTALRHGPHEEAWTRAHSQRGPPESRTPTSFT